MGITVSLRHLNGCGLIKKKIQNLLYNKLTSPGLN